MISPEVIFASTTLLLLGLLLILALLRWHLRGALIFHLVIFTSLSLLVNLLILMAFLDVTTQLNYPLTVEFTLLALALSFGALTLAFLRKAKRGLGSYWAISLIILALWSSFTLNYQGQRPTPTTWLGWPF